MKEDSQENRNQPCSPGAAVQWRESNTALARLLARHPRILNRAIAKAVEIGRGIDELTPSMAALCIRTCRFCPEPCCITNTVWFDFQDLLFFHLLHACIPAYQAVAEPNDACPFLSHHGCRLPPRTRPWMCIRYLCPAQCRILENQGPPPASDLTGKIAIIAKQRAGMEAEVVYRIKQTQPCR